VVRRVVFPNFGRSYSGSFDKKRSTFEFLARAVYSTQTMSVNTVNEYKTFLSLRNDSSITPKKNRVQTTLTTHPLTSKDILTLGISLGFHIPLDWSRWGVVGGFSRCLRATGFFKLAHGVGGMGVG
jgi:hypothetical protein